MWTQTGTGTLQPLARARRPERATPDGAAQARRRDGLTGRADLALAPGCGGAAAGPAPRRRAGTRGQVVRDLLGGSFVLAVWLALWTVTWAAVAGPLSPLRPPAAGAAAETARAAAPGQGAAP